MSFFALLLFPVSGCTCSLHYHHYFRPWLLLVVILEFDLRLDSLPAARRGTKTARVGQEREEEVHGEENKATGSKTRGVPSRKRRSGFTRCSGHVFLYLYNPYSDERHNVTFLYSLLLLRRNLFTYLSYKSFVRIFTRFGARFCPRCFSMLISFNFGHLKPCSSCSSYLFILSSSQALVGATVLVASVMFYENRKD